MVSRAAEDPAQTIIDHASPLALYEQVKQILAGQIERGELQPGDTLPPDRGICERFGVSRITVTRALTDLARLGLIDRLQGRLSVVCPPRVRRSFDEMIGLTEALHQQGLTTHSRVLSKDEVALDALPDPDGFRGRRFVRIKRLRFVGQRPAVIATSFLPERLATKLAGHDLETESFYEMFERVLGKRIVRRECTFVPVVADAGIADLLKVSRNSPHFCVQGKTYVDGDRLIELTRSIFHGEVFEFSANMRRVRDDVS